MPRRLSRRSSRRLSRRSLRRLILAVAIAGASVLAGPASAASVTRDVVLGDEVNATARTGDVHTYRLPLVAGSTLRVRVRTKDSHAPDVVLTLRDPSGALVETRTGDDVRIDVASAAAGTWRAEVASTGGEAEYEVEFTGSAPSTGGGGTVAGPGTFHVDPPRGATVRIEVRRKSGSAAVVTGVRDGSGRAIAFEVDRTSRDRVRLEALPVSAPGGLDVDVQSADGGAGLYEVRFRVTDDDDDGPSSHDHERESRRLVLTLAPGADPQAVADALGYELEEVGDGFIVVETESEGTEYEDAAAADDALPEVLAAEPDAFIHMPEGTQSNHVILGSGLGRADVTAQPALDQMRAAIAQQRATGSGIVVAVLDTGADLTHEMLAGHLVAGRDFVGDGVTAPDDDPSEETNGIDDDGDLDVDEGFGHGTFIAGLVLAVAPDAKVMPVRVLDTDARGTVSAIAAGIEWAVKNGAHVVNLSLGMDVRSGVLADAVRYAIANGVVVVAATGNDAQPAAVDFPATVSGVVAVTATDTVTQGPADFANGGPQATAAAPGVSVVGPVAGGGYGTWSGTSFSAALASGGAALLVQQRPAITPTQAAARFRATARPAPAGVPRAQRRRLGGGRIDLARLVR